MAGDHGQVRVFLVQHSGNWAAGGDPAKAFDVGARKLRTEAAAPVSPAASAAAVGGQVPSAP